MPMIVKPLTCLAMLAACTSAPREAATRTPSSRQETVDDRSSKAIRAMTNRHADQADQAAQGPIATAVSAAQNPAPEMVSPLAADAEGRRILSTAFVRSGPDGYVAIELRDGRTLILRDIVMRANDYCGLQTDIKRSGVRHCGGYADIAAARPSGPPIREPAASTILGAGAAPEGSSDPS